MSCLGCIWICGAERHGVERTERLQHDDDTFVQGDGDSGE